ncbi:hypothetical protein EDE15_5023 [Edaphobacter aggregans]|uniref:Uncharacterized protein n=1 Tax=Edaphobacter aggregans TaxID=570835 RepID=A0A3R9QDZ3_9BACT|nr:hypothetical protein EDE15_5023 [Edaphobacter aggregans]
MQRRRAILLLAGAASGSGVPRANSAAEQRQFSIAYVAWVTEVLKRMQTIKPGMTRKTLLKVFTTEGGLSTGLQRTYVSRDCPYFKVDVAFQPVGRPDRDASGGVTLEEREEDIILSVSRPYLEFSIMD